MIRSSVNLFCLLATGVIWGSAEARASDYRRAQGLAKSDPLEAEALYERFIRDTNHAKMRRAANYELFFLRLRHARLAEAFAQAAATEFGEKYRTTVADAYGISPEESSRLVRNLRRVCAKKLEVSHLGDYLREKELPPLVWDFALRVMLRCGIQPRSDIFFHDLFELEQPTRAQTVLRLIAIREQLYVDADKAAKLYAITRAVVENQYIQDEQLNVQWTVLGARIAAAQKDYARMIAFCEHLPVSEAAKQARTSCKVLKTYAYLQQGDAERAWQEISTVQINPMDVDARLLRLIVSVAAGVAKPEGLAAFRKRASYTYCAQSLRVLAESFLDSQNFPSEAMQQVTQPQ